MNLMSSLLIGHIDVKKYKIEEFSELLSQILSGITIACINTTILFPKYTNIGGTLWLNGMCVQISK